MDGESLSQEKSDCKEEMDHPDKNNNSQTHESDRVLPTGETAESQGLMEKTTEKGEEDTVPKEETEKAAVGDKDDLQTTSKPVEGNSRDTDKSSTEADMRDSEATSGEKGGDENMKSGQLNEVAKCEKHEDNITDKEKTKTGGKRKEEDKVRKGEVEAKDKGKIKEAEKQGKAKRKSGTTSSSAPHALSRPRPSARSIRASAKNDIMAKFQQGAPETPVPRNFKIQRSATAGATGASIKQKILQWCCNKTRKYEGINIENFSSSWCDGMAFCALIHRYFPDAFDYSSLNPKERKKNLTLAFQTAESLADCCPLLDVSDMLMMGDHPDPMCVFTYVQSLCHSLSKIEKERKDKEQKEKAAKEGEDKEEDVAGEEATEKDEGQSAENEMGKQEDNADTKETGEEEDGLKSCGTEGDAEVAEVAL